MMLGKFPVPGHPSNFDNSRTRPTTLGVGASGFVFQLTFPLFLPLSGRRPDTDSNNCLKETLKPPTTNQF